MPDPYERHGRSSWEWGPAPPRGQARAAAADQGLVPAKRPPGKKDPALCKAAHWKGPHVPEFRVREYGWQRREACRWRISWRHQDEPAWHCEHAEVCSGCGKVLRSSVPAQECPDYRGITDSELAQIEIERNRWRQRAFRRRPVIDGPQGYRKPKAGS